MPSRGKMTYSKAVAPKLAILLQHESFNADTVEYLANCCHFHGCRRNTIHCKSVDDQYTFLIQNYTKEKYIDALVIQHYSRSLEKFSLKARTWMTAAHGDGSYDIGYFLHRNVGHIFDSRMLRYTCQLRQHLIDHTGYSSCYCHAWC